MNRHSIKTRTFGLMLGFVGTLGVAFAAHAGDEMPSTAFVHESAVVRYDDLSLDSAAGIKALYARLTHAAARVCGSEPHVAELRRRAQYRSCYNSALNKAIDKIGNDNLQALQKAESRSAHGRLTLSLCGRSSVSGRAERRRLPRARVTACMTRRPGPVASRSQASTHAQERHSYFSLCAVRGRSARQPPSGQPLVPRHAISITMRSHP